ncbi:Na(+)/H(+) antiporter subunit C [Herbiconiux sp. L3-i23]|uniref:Na(+)/H(+) antiporter subunit C n=1 Tax=Herbiconiux sp. L3-i23 TaxID=2905871 RepID=UPI00204D46C9|nr:Na(+)/H(+) antiporter subunit C [Herbiconiux sp. L3-i23]BDI21746.1 NADH-ubiquinone oxidoreductase, chain 4L precursor [Herbiconiux sp. L3-i23]
MTVSLALLITMAVLYACGVYLLLEKSMTRVILGFLLIGNATNILLLIVSGPSGTAPIVDGETDPATFADPLPQALILTAIVITFAVSAFLMALVYRSWRLAKEDALTVDPDDVALRTRLAQEPEMPDADEDDTEFGVRADAAVAGATDLDVRPRAMEDEANEEGKRS